MHEYIIFFIGRRGTGEPVGVRGVDAEEVAL
jgi:hypothetical protein